MLAVGMAMVAWPAPAASPATPLTVSGRVVSGDRPIAGARVSLTAVESPYAAARRQLRHEPASPAAETTTASDGSYRLAAPASGLWQARVMAKGYATQRLDLFPLVEAANLPVVDLTAAGEHTVTVLDAGGRPVAGAWVELRPEAAARRLFANAPAWMDDRVLAATDTAGVARLVTTAGGGLRAWSADGGEASWNGIAMPASLTLRLPVVSPRAVVVRDGGRPFGGALLVAGVSSIGAAEAAASRPLATTADNGRARLAVPRSQPIQVTAWTADGAAGSALLTPAPTPAADAPAAAHAAPVVIALAASPVLTGRVLDAQTRAAIPDAVVWILGREFAATNTDGQGAFHLASDLPRLLLVAAAAGHQRTTLELAAANGVFDRQPTLLLEPAVALRGRVLDDSRRPIAGARIGLAEARAESGADGRFLLTGLTPANPATLTAEHDDFSPLRRGLTTPAAGAPAGELELVMGRGQLVRGRLVDSEGEPVSGARIELVEVPDLRFGRGPGTASVERSAASGVDGRFVVDRLATGRYALAVHARGCATHERPSVVVPAPDPGADPGEVDLGTIILVAGVGLSGQVIDEAGVGVGGAIVEALGRSSGMPRFSMGRGDAADRTTSEADGSFRLADRRIGEELALVASHAGYAPAQVSAVVVRADTEPVRMVLRATVAVSGRVVDERGDGVSGAFVAVVEQREGIDSSYLRPTVPVSTDDAGYFAIAEVEPIRGQLVVDAAGWLAPPPTSLDLTAGRDVDGIEVRLSRAGSLRGRVTDEGGEPLAEVHLDLAPGDARVRWLETPHAVTDGDGSYELGPLPLGRQVVLVSAADHVSTRRDVEVVAGPNLLDVVLASGVEVSGTVRDAEETPVAGAMVVLRGTDLARPLASTDASGAFRIAGVAPGSYTLTARADGYASSPALALTVGPEPLPGLVLHVSAGVTLRGRILGLEPEQLGGVTVSASAIAQLNFLSGVVASDGTYQVAHLSPGSWRVTAQVEQRRVTRHLDVTGEPPALDLPFENGVRLSGLATYRGEPLAGAEITLLRGGSAITDPQGHFEIADLPVGHYVLVLEQLERGLQHLEEIDLDADRKMTIDVVTAPLAGHVVDATTDTPLAGARVTLASPLDRIGVASSNLAAVSDADGAFTFGELSTGSWPLTASLAGYQNATVTAEVGSDDVSDLRVGLEPGALLTLNVRAAAGGLPSGSLLIGAVDTSGAVAVFEATPGEGGRVDIERLAPGAWTLYLRGFETAQTGLAVTVPGRAEVVLPALTEAHIRVPALVTVREPAQLTARQPSGALWQFLGGGQLRGSIDVRDGSLDLRSLPPGRWTIEVTGPDGRTFRGTVDLVAGAAATLVLE